MRRLRISLLAIGGGLAVAGIAGASETITYTYDARGRLVKVDHGTTGPTPNVIANYAYDAADNRCQTMVTATGGAGTVSCSGGGAAPSFAIGNVSVSEGGTASFTVTRSGSMTGTFSVNYATAAGTATAGTDYMSQSGTVTFVDGDSTETIAIVTTQETTVEPDETFYVDLSNPSGGTITTSRGTGTILNDDVAPTCGGVSFATGNAAAVTEGANLSFTVTKSGTATGSCSVNYTTANGTATAGSDYTATSGTLTFTSAQTALGVTVPTTDDATVESPETVLLNISSATGGATISSGQGSGTINDNDSSNQPPTCTTLTIGPIPGYATSSINVTSAMILGRCSDPNGGTLTITSPMVPYTINVLADGQPITRNHTVSDGQGGSATMTIYVTRN